MASRRPACIVLLAVLCLYSGGAAWGAEDASRRPVSLEDWARWWAFHHEAETIWRWPALGGHGGRPPDAPRPPPESVPVSAQALRQVVLPVLERAVSGGGAGANTTGAALIALGKTACDAEHIRMLTRACAAGRRRSWSSAFEEECAVLALGLLRRTDPASRFGAERLDATREVLFGILADEGRKRRTRAFAACALGLLGDQPTGMQGLDPIARQLTTARLFDLLVRHGEDEELATGILVGIGLQSGDSLTPAHHHLLVRLADAGRLGRKPISDSTSAWALSAWSRLQPRDALPLLARVLRAGDAVGVERRRAAAIALGHQAHRCPTSLRVTRARALVAGLVAETDTLTRHLARMSLARLLGAELQEGESAIVTDGGTRAVLMAALTSRDPSEFVSAVFAVAVALRGASHDASSAPGLDLDLSARVALRAHLERADLDRNSRAGLLLAAGLLREPGARPLLFGVLADSHRHPDLRRYAAEGIGLLGSVRSSEARVLGQVLCTTRDYGLLQATCRASALLGTPILEPTGEQAVDLLGDRSTKARTQNDRQCLALGLAFCGDRRALPLLAALAEDEKGSDLTRALACMGLGVLADPEWIPSLARLQADANFGAATDALRELWTVF